LHEPIHRYHDGTKHHFHRFAPSLGYLDWASQPNPFRSFREAREVALHPRPDASAETTAIGNLLRYALGLSAWKQDPWSRWSLRVNPSSGNLHPTEAHVVLGPLSGLTDWPGVYHYASDRHVLEQRCAFDTRAWFDAVGDLESTMLIALTSIHWREAWKYGERAFRYCQHDLGHAIAAVSIAATLVGRRALMLPEWSQRDIASLVGLDRDEDYVEAEREEAACIMAVSSSQSSGVRRDTLLNAVRAGRWTGRASQLSEDHVEWTFIDEIARATEDYGRVARLFQGRDRGAEILALHQSDRQMRRLILQRRSALALDGRSSIDAQRFFSILSQAMPSAGAPWDALWWDARIHLALFVHRVDDVVPGLYLLVRNVAAIDRLKAACRTDFLWERGHTTLPFFMLARGDCRSLAERLSCDQSIAADGFFSLGMLADFDASLEEFGPSFYRQLFWESGVVGQVLYLAGEPAGARGTGIGCFYDDPVHDVLGVTGHAFQSLYHFAIGIPVSDARVTTDPGYSWESTVAARATSASARRQASQSSRPTGRR
jgi:SagB-type dehydrogenase family enzyme